MKTLRTNVIHLKYNNQTVISSNMLRLLNKNVNSCYNCYIMTFYDRNVRSTIDFSVSVAWFDPF